MLIKLTPTKTEDDLVKDMKKAEVHRHLPHHIDVLPDILRSVPDIITLKMLSSGGHYELKSKLYSVGVNTSILEINKSEYDAFGSDTINKIVETAEGIRQEIADIARETRAKITKTESSTEKMNLLEAMVSLIDSKVSSFEIFKEEYDNGGQFN